MGLLTEKYNAWAKHPEKYTAKQVLDQIVADLKWLDEEQAKNCVIPAVMGELTCDSCGCHPNVIYTNSKGRFCEQCKPSS